VLSCPTINNTTSLTFCSTAEGNWKIMKEPKGDKNIIGKLIITKQHLFCRYEKEKINMNGK